MLASGQGEAVNPLPVFGFRMLEVSPWGLQVPIPACWLLLLVSSSKCLQGTENTVKAFCMHVPRWSSL